MLSTLACVAVVTLGGTAAAQQDFSSRLRPIPAPPKAVTYEVATGRFRSRTATLAMTGPFTVYNNTCDSALPGFYQVICCTEVLAESGQLPGDDKTVLPGCGGPSSSYKITGFRVAYCADTPTIDLTTSFYTEFIVCRPIASATHSATIPIAGLP